MLRTGALWKQQLFRNEYRRNANFSRLHRSWLSRQRQLNVLLAAITCRPNVLSIAVPLSHVRATKEVGSLSNLCWRMLRTFISVQVVTRLKVFSSNKNAGSVADAAF